VTRLALFVLAAALVTHHWQIAAGAALIVAIPLAFKLGGHHTARKSGVGMVRTGTRRIVTGRL
jgi:hypothetical protein